MKVHEFIQNPRVWLVLVLLGVGLGGFGCATNGADTENVSSKPWNSPEGWQNGSLPSMMQQPH